MSISQTTSTSWLSIPGIGKSFPEIAFSVPQRRFACPVCNILVNVL